MKNYSYKTVIVFFCLLINFVLISGAFAEETNVQAFDTSVITGFESGAYDYVVNTEYKYALIELEKEFPSQLPVRLGGKAFYQKGQDGTSILANVENYQTKSINVTWVCQENYDEDLKTFHFVPDFKTYNLAAGLDVPVITVNVMGELMIPPLYPMPEEKHRPFTITEDSSEMIGAPSYYNNYESGKLPAIRNQNPYGTCWAFASLAAVEADLIHDGKASTNIDLSELHLIYFTYHKFYDEKGLNQKDKISGVPSQWLIGGSNGLGANSLMNMLGPVKESSAPYTLHTKYSPDASKGRTGDYHITGAYLYDIKNNRNSVKNAIMNHGAVAVSINADDRYYSYTYNSYYCPESKIINHGVSIVGWDDNFSRNEFKSGKPEGNGAWLVRNSWGVNAYDYSGYFWMSYYDKSLDTIAYAYDALPGRYDHVYAYDNSPSVNWMRVYDGNNASQSFYVDGGEEIKAIGFYTEDANLGIKFTVSSGGKSVTKKITTSAPGYYLVPLENTLEIKSRSKVTVSFSFTSGYYQYAYVEAGDFYFTNMSLRLSSGTDSDGMIINGQNVGYDGKIKLFTKNIASSGPSFSLKDSNIRGKNKEIQISIPWSDTKWSSVGYGIYDDSTGQSISPTVKDRWDSTGKNVILSFIGSPLVNGKVYRISLSIYVDGKWSNTVTKYGMPIANVYGATVVAGNKTMVINTQHREPATGTRYMIYDGSTEKELYHKVGTKTNTTWTNSSLTNGKLYYVVAVPYRDYKGQRLWGPNQNRIYFIPMVKPTDGKVTFSGSNATVSIASDSSVNGIRVLYRTVGGALKNGCESTGSKCTIKGLNRNTAYEFYAMKYKTARSRKYYSMGLLIPYKVSASGLTAPQSNPVVAMSNSGYTIFTIRKSSNATGISVLYREGEGVFRQACEASGNSCSTTLNTSKNYTFYIMQYRIRNGKKVYSDGIIARDFSSGKSGEYERLYTGFTLADENFDLEGIYNALDDFYTEEDLLHEEAFAAMGEDMISKDVVEYGDYEFDDVDYSWVDEPGDYLYDVQESYDNPIDEDSMDDGFATVSIDEVEPSEVNFTGDEGDVLSDPEDPKADAEDEVYLYTFDDAVPFYPVPSFGNK